jgi:hypothetical protein
MGMDPFNFRRCAGYPWRSAWPKTLRLQNGRTTNQRTQSSSRNTRTNCGLPLKAWRDWTQVASLTAAG